MQSEAKDLNWLERVASAVKHWARSDAARDELAGCGKAEVDKMARDLGVPTEELWRLAQTDENSAALLYHRLAQLKIDPQRLDPAILRDLERCCSECASKGQCAKDLRSAQPAQHTPDYCPNQKTLDIVTAKKAH